LMLDTKGDGRRVTAAQRTTQEWAACAIFALRSRGRGFTSARVPQHAGAGAGMGPRGVPLARDSSSPWVLSSALVADRFRLIAARGSAAAKKIRHLRALESELTPSTDHVVVSGCRRLPRRVTKFLTRFEAWGIR
jgi:hypothetical protein